MWFMNLKKTTCKNCYACIRSCSIHAIEVKNEQAQIMRDRCILCGRCSKACPQGIKIIRSELRLVKRYLENKDTVVASVSPSFPAVFGKNSDKLPRVLKMLGFDYFEETLAGIDPIIDEYENYANKDDEDTYITSFCPSVNLLVQKHYPDLIKNLVPVVSPAVYHGRVLKEKYGKNVKVVFIGPCISKKTECQEEYSIDAVITFKELIRWIREENIELDSLDEEPFGYFSEDKRVFPILGGLGQSISHRNPKKDVIEVDGLEECMEVLKSIQKGRLKNTFIDMSCCRHSCLGGFGMPRDNVSCYEREQRIRKYSSSQVNIPKKLDDKSKRLLKEDCNIDTYKLFTSLNIPLKIPTDIEIKKILNTMGKYTLKDELNCGSCGYHTCKEKAIAVYNNMAEVNMCLPFMREKAENLANIIFETTPNMIVILNKELDILQLNPSAREFLGIEEGIEKGMPIVMFLDDKIFSKVRMTRKNIFRERVVIKNKMATVIQSVIWLEKEQLMLWIADDITENEKKEKKVQKMKIDAMDMAQHVINKQMTVAQEIASLLGETTAETKVTLTNLKKLILEEEEEQVDE